MADVWSKFNRAVDLDGLKKDMASAGKNKGKRDYPEIPAGQYEVKLASLEQKLTKSGEKRPMVSASFKIIKGKYKNQRIFENKVIFGTKNDGAMIKGVCSFLDSLDSGLDIDFEDYGQFADLVMDVAEAVEENGLEYVVEYDPDDFYSVSIKEVFD